MMVRVSCRDGAQFSELLQESKSQLYPKQVEEYQQQHSSGREKLLPKAFSRPGSAPDLDSLAVRVQQFLNQKDAQEKEQKALEELVPETQAAKEDKGAMSGEEEILDMAPPSHLPQACQASLERRKLKRRAVARANLSHQGSRSRSSRGRHLQLGSQVSQLLRTLMLMLHQLRVEDQRSRKHHRAARRERTALQRLRLPCPSLFLRRFLNKANGGAKCGRLAKL